jgi:hypothetical protein
MQVLSRAPDLDPSRVQNALRLVLTSLVSEYDCQP